jgi:hypothetical protein
MSSSISAPEGYIEQAFEFCWDTLGNFLRVSEVFPAALDQAQDAFKNEMVFATIRSAKATNFTTAIAAWDKENESIAGLASNKIKVKNIIIESYDNLDWNADFWKKNTFNQFNDPDTDSFSGGWKFSKWDGSRKQMSPGPALPLLYQFYYFKQLDGVIMECLDGNFTMNCSIMNASEVAKTVYGAGTPPTGYLILEVSYEPMA